MHEIEIFILIDEAGDYVLAKEQDALEQEPHERISTSLWPSERGDARCRRCA